MKYRDLERSIQWMESIAGDDAHGYSMSSRYSPNFDCSSFISFALIFGGFNVRYDSVTWNLYSQVEIHHKVYLDDHISAAQLDETYEIVEKQGEEFTIILPVLTVFEN